MSKNYIVIALCVGGLGNKIFNEGDTVTEKNFPEGNAEKLVEQGFLKSTDEDSDEDTFAITEKSKAKDIKKALDALGATYDAKASKDDLYLLYLDAAKALEEAAPAVTEDSTDALADENPDLNA